MVMNVGSRMALNKAKMKRGEKPSAKRGQRRVRRQLKFKTRMMKKLGKVKNGTKRTKTNK